MRSSRLSARQTRAILFLTPGFPADEQDTGCVSAVQNYVAAYAAAHPCRPLHVVAFQYPYERATYRWHGVTVHALAGRNRGRWYRPLLWMRAALLSRYIARHRQVGVLHSFWLGECTLVGQWLARWLNVPHVASIGGQDARRENHYLRRLRVDRMTITAGSAFAAEAYGESTGRTVDAVVPIGLDPAFLRPTDAEEGRDIDVLGVGSLIEMKRYEVFVDLIARIVEEHPALRAVIVGDGPRRSQLQVRIDAAGLTGSLQLAGRTDRDDVRRYMRRSRVLLHPSEYESQGYVFLEALANRMYVVSRRVGFVGGHPAAYRCGDDGEMERRVRQLLRAQCLPPHGHVMSVGETVERFDEIYRGASRPKP